ncbi:MAG: hypothetical protein AAFW81_10770 [Pseudomonadota bacterium]
MQAGEKAWAAAIFGAVMFFTAQAAAADRPPYCPRDHDHRTHHADYYDYYAADRYSRGGDRYGHKRYRGDRYGRYGRYGRARSEVVFRRHFDLRQYNAYITVVEENYWTRSGRVQRVCSVLVRGPDAYYVPQRRLERAANRNCSRYARIQFLS